MAGVVLENVSRDYAGKVSALQGVSLEVVDRELLVLVGPSGCGKTTTLRLIAGLEELSGGKIAIGGRVVNDVPPKDRDIAMVFQSFALVPHLSVERNLAFGLELREKASGLGGWRRAGSAGRDTALTQRRLSIAARVRETAQALGIEELLKRYPRQLSGGERQRVALGRAIIRTPTVFLFDEPLSNLDAKLRVEMRQELKRLHRRLRTTMVYVTHDQVEALTLGDRIAVMNEGMIQQVGRPLDVYDWPINRFVASFIGTPAMNFLGGEFDDEAGRPRFRIGEWSLPLVERGLGMTPGSRRRAVLGVRPQDVRLERVTSGPPKGALTGVVRLLEPVGDATIVTTEISGCETPSADEKHKNEPLCVSSKEGSRTALREGDRVVVEVDGSRCHVFDPVTGENWVRRPAERERA